LPRTGVVPEPGLPRYRVEFILFAHTNVDPGEEEFIYEYESPAASVPTRRFGERLFSQPFPDTLDARDLEAADNAALPEPEPNADPFEFIDPFGQLTDPGSGPGSQSGFRFRLLRADELELNDAFARINRLGAYRALAHGGWIQEGLDETSARPMNLANLGVVNPTGTLTLRLSRFLHLDIDLQYQPDRTPTVVGPGVSALEQLQLQPRYRILGERRARSGELHYIDHPLFGLLFMISPAPAEGGSEDADAETAPAA
jgi:hypothetical protein